MAAEVISPEFREILEGLSPNQKRKILVRPKKSQWLEELSNSREDSRKVGLGWRASTRLSDEELERKDRETGESARPVIEYLGKIKASYNPLNTGMVVTELNRDQIYSLEKEPYVQRIVDMEEKEHPMFRV